MKELSTLQWEESGSDAFHFGKPLLQENEVQSKVVLRLLAEEFQFSTSSIALNIDFVLSITFRYIPHRSLSISL